MTQYEKVEARCPHCENLQKFMKDGKVGILVSPGYGAGFSSWVYDIHPGDARLVELVYNQRFEEAANLCNNLFNTGYTEEFFRDLDIEWLAPGTLYRIEEYDGSEQLVLFHASNYFAA